MPPQPASENFYYEQDTLNKILANHQASDYELPPLVVERTVFEKLQNFIADLYEVVASWLRSLGFQGTMPEHAEEIFRFGFNLICFVVLVSLVAYIFLMIKKLLFPFGEHESSLFSESSVHSRENVILQQLTEAVRAQNWPQALRLRWKLFLLRIHAPRNRTPMEYFRSGGGEIPEVFQINELYSVMFGGKVTNKPYFQEYSAQLRHLEDQPSAP